METLSIGLEVRFILAALFVWRLSYMISHEDGLWDMFLNLRLWAGAKPEAHFYPDGEQVLEWQAFTVFGKLLLCPLCLSVWIAVPLELWVSGICMDTVVVWLAISGAASLAELIVNKG